MFTTTPKKAVDFIRAAYKTRQPVFLHGSPGIGKSDAVKQAAKELDINLIDIRASQLDPVDIRGIPTIAKNKTDWAIPSFLPTDGQGIIFADELNLAPNAVQAAFYQLILDRRVGDYELPEGWTIVAAGNLDSDRSITTRMAPPLRNRFALHLKIEPNLDEWIEWAIEHDVPHEIVGYIKWRPDNLYTFDPKRDEFAFATPRSWAFFADWFKHTQDYLPYAIGCLGEAVAMDFKAYMDVARRVPDIDKIMAGKKVQFDNDDPALNYATAAAIGHRMDKNNAKHALKFLDDHMAPEYTVMAIKYALTKDTSLMTAPAIGQWVAKNKNLFIS